MELILIKPLRKVGKIGDIIKVKNGYGRNLLIPQKFAIRATEKNKKIFEEQRKSLEEKNQQLYIQAEKISDLLQGKELTFIRQASEDGKLFGSVSNKEIASSLSEMIGEDVNYSQIHLQDLIKHTGFYDIEVVLHPEKTVNIKLGVGRTDIEAESILRSSLDNAKKIVDSTEENIESDIVTEQEENSIENN